MDLWEHQSQALAGLRAAIRAGKKRIVLQAPPGAGKTEIAAEVVKGARGKANCIAFTVPLLGLVDQTLNRFALRGIALDDMGVMQADHPMRRPHAPVQVCSVQTLGKRGPPFAHIGVIDECHIQFKAIREWMASQPDMIFIGLSATPWSRGLGDYWQELVIIETIRGLQAKGILTPSRTFCPRAKPDLSAVKVSHGDYAQDELSEVMQERRLVADVAQTWIERAQDRPTLVFAVDRAHAAKIADEFNDVGVKARYVDGYTDSDERQAYIKELERGETKAIISIGTMTTGVDIPCVRCIQYVRPTKSPILFVQSLTRGLRAFPGKTDCLIFDHSTTTMGVQRHGVWVGGLGPVEDIGSDITSLRPAVKPKEAKKREVRIPLPRECECGYVVPPKEVHCPNCGERIAMRSGIRTEDGELVEINEFEQARHEKAAENRVWTLPEKGQFYAELLGYAEAAGYQRGWAAHVYQARFGVWPNAFGKNVTPVWPPSRDTASYIRGASRRRA